MQEHHLTVSRTARYCTLGRMTEHTRTVWFVCHGYGQLAPYFIKKFEAIANPDTLIVAPEALSRFYLKEFSGRVGATWMTREERPYEIADYLNYLNDLYAHTLKGFDVNSLQINVLGFSQGTTTVCRWVNQQSVKFDKLVLWAGYFGNGLHDVLDPHTVAEKEVHFVYGTHDEFLSNIDLVPYEANLRSVVPHIKVSTFEGGHSIEAEALLRIR